jgi:tetratricopeptide (TPR) repeat protein
MGRISMRQGDWQAAVRSFQQACELDSTSITATTLHALALRHSGQSKLALQEFRAILGRDPLNLMVLREIAALADEKSPPFGEKLPRLLADDRQYHLDLAVNYLQAGLPKEALAVLDEAARDWSYPMLDYLAGYLLLKLGQSDKALARYHLAAAAGPDFVFPSRIEEALALQDVIRQAPEDYKARYYLGNFYYAHERYPEAITLWEDALAYMDSYDVLYRNLGLAYWQRQGDHARAIATFEKSLACNPKNQDIYLHLDELYKLTGMTDQRRELLARIRAIKDLREDVRKRSITMMVELGRFDEALSCLLSEEYVPLEMDQSFHETYVNALLQRAEVSLAAGRIEQAILDYQKALVFPKNLGVGRPTTSAQAEVYYRLGCACERAGRFQGAIDAWKAAAGEHHPYGSKLYPFIQAALDKLSRYSDLGFGL